YSLVNEGDGQNDRFGNEAVQALLKRAEDDRDRLVIILAGYERQMEAFLASNPGLTSRFAIRIKFGGGSPGGRVPRADPVVGRPRCYGGCARRWGAGGLATISATAASCAACSSGPARPGTSGSWAPMPSLARPI